MIQNEELAAFFQEEYRCAHGTRRDLRATDRLQDDLALESLILHELLVALEDRYDIRLLHDPRMWTAATVGDLLDTVRALEVEQRDVPVLDGAQ
jgi:acyl carrier protein